MWGWSIGNWLVLVQWLWYGLGLALIYVIWYGGIGI